MVHTGYTKRRQLDVDGDERDAGESRCQLRHHGSHAATEVENTVCRPDLHVSQAKLATSGA